MNRPGLRSTQLSTPIQCYPTSIKLDRAGPPAMFIFLVPFEKTVVFFPPPDRFLYAEHLAQQTYAHGTPAGVVSVIVQVKVSRQSKHIKAATGRPSRSKRKAPGSRRRSGFRPENGKSRSWVRSGRPSCRRDSTGRVPGIYRIAAGPPPGCRPGGSENPRLPAGAFLCAGLSCCCLPFNCSRNASQEEGRGIPITTPAGWLECSRPSFPATRERAGRAWESCRKEEQNQKTDPRSRRCVRKTSRK